jgi:hypothetical protein
MNAECKITPTVRKTHRKVLSLVQQVADSSGGDAAPTDNLLSGLESYANADHDGSIVPIETTPLQRLGGLQKDVLNDLELLKSSTTASQCYKAKVDGNLGFDPSYLIGRMLDHSKQLIEVMEMLDVPEAPKSKPLACDVPTVMQLFSCYTTLIRIYRMTFSSILDSVPGLPMSTPLFSGLNLGGFSLEGRVDLQIGFLIQVSEDLLARLESTLGIGEGALSGRGIIKSEELGRLLQTMLTAEAGEQPPLYEPRGYCPSLQETLKRLKQKI